MVARLNRPVGKDGVLAYQDSEDITTFHYFPARIDAVLDETLISFRTMYYGINKTPYFIDLGKRNYQSVVGSTVSGQAVADITEKQRQAIIAEAKKIYKVKEVNLVPLVLEEVTVQPITDKNIVEMGGDSTTTFPDRLQIGSQFGFNVNSGNSLFAELVGHQGSSDTSKNPSIGVNFYGTTEMRADPWEAEITADLSQVWEYTRSQFSASAKLGWLNIGGASFDKITQDLIKKNIVKIKYIQGGGGKEFGWQLLNSTKELFESINKQITSGEGLFKFEPNPTPQEPPAKEQSLLADLLPWSVSINMSYVSNVFKQKIEFKNTITFEGNIPVHFSGNMSLALLCNSQTQSHFYDLQLKADGCITKEKSDGLQSRMLKETTAKDKKIKEYLAKVEAGIWSVQQFGEMLGLLNTISLTETKANFDVTCSKVLSEDEAHALLADREAILEASWSEQFQPLSDDRRFHKVFPGDNRKRVAKTNTAPWNAVGLLTMKFPSGKTFVGTGTLVDAGHVVTAAHNLYDSNDGGQATSVSFAPGNNATDQPYGNFNAAKLHYLEAFTHAEGDTTLDYAVVTLAKKVPSTIPPYVLKVAADKDLQSMEFQIAGYPSDKVPAKSMWVGTGKLTAVKPKVLEYKISTYTGQSGSAVAAKSGDKWAIFGIHSGATADANEACRITSTVFKQINTWVGENKAVPEAADY